MAKKPDRTFDIICELLEHLTLEAENLRTAPAKRENPADKDKPKDKKEEHTYRFVINSPKDRLDAIIRLLFGEEIIELKRGNRSFRTRDKELMRELYAEMKTSRKSFSDLIEKYIPRAERRTKDVDDESVRARLEDAFYEAKTEDEHAQETSAFFKELDLDESKYHDNAEDDLHLLLPWLRKYKAQLIKLLDL